MKSGWIHKIKTHHFTTASTNNKNYVTMRELFNEIPCLVLQCSYIYSKQVKHSQRLSATPLFPWVIAAQKGDALFAHYLWHKYHICSLGEMCSHIAAILSCELQYYTINLALHLNSVNSSPPTARDVS